MMLPEGHGLHPREDGKKRFFNLSSGVFVRPRLPLLRDHIVLCSADGLLLLVRPRQYTQGNRLCLLHPFTGDVVELPENLPLPADITLPANLRAHLPINMFAAVCTSPDGVLGVMVAFQNTPFVLFASTRRGVEFICLTLLPTCKPIIIQRKTLHVAGADICGWLGTKYSSVRPTLAREFNDIRFSFVLFLVAKLVATCPADKFQSPELVECDYEILVVGYREGGEILIYRLADLAQGKFVPVKSIGGNALLIDTKRNLTFSFSAVPIITGDIIVLANPPLAKYILQYDPSSNTWSSRVRGCAKHGCSMECCTCSLIDHMCNTCRCVSKWNKGGGIIDPARWNNNHFIANNIGWHI
ncbi:uncharacterized protein [Triticum aestivum]|uniref:uncharacterized protein n=1 Tax=Triticum aestivum TaxID=4565 RepID=UPI001D01EEA1|nr:uncharacterized protein LOC123063529 [Triticum aestivum]